MMWLLAIVVWAALVCAAHAGDTTQRDAPTARYYSPNGALIGVDRRYGDTIRQYDAQGRLLGTVRASDGGRR